MQPSTRRGFLSEVGRGMIAAAIGCRMAAELDLAPALADDDSPGRLRFGSLEPLVDLMQETDPDRLLPQVVERLRSGTPLRDIVAAGSLANARTFGGEDYVGFHTMMAFAPCYRMATQLPAPVAAMPVLKVLYRNSRRIAEHGGPQSEVLHPVAAGDVAGSPNGQALLEAVRRKEMDRAERLFAAISTRPAEDAFDELLIAVQDSSEVHRVVLPYRAWDLLGIVGQEHAHTLLRQSVRYCVRNESEQYGLRFAGGRNVLPRLLDEYRLEDSAHERPADDEWVARLADTIFRSAPDTAAESVAGALAEGFPPSAIGEAISLAANQLVLRDAGRPAEQAQPPEKPAGSIHGDSIGVHASDSANAWRNMAGVGSRRNRVACLILGAHQVAADRSNRGGNFLEWQPYPTEEHLALVGGKSPEELLRETEAAIRASDQPRAAAAIARYGKLDGEPRAALDLLLRYSVSEDGALHAEKYYQTVSEDFAATRSSLRWRHMVGLARVAASAFGHPAPGLEQARKLLET